MHSHIHRAEQLCHMHSHIHRAEQRCPALIKLYYCLCYGYTEFATAFTHNGFDYQERNLTLVNTDFLVF